MGLCPQNLVGGGKKYSPPALSNRAGLQGGRLCCRAHR